MQSFIEPQSNNIYIFVIVIFLYREIFTMHVVIMTRYQNRNTGLGEVQLCPYRKLPLKHITYYTLSLFIAQKLRKKQLSTPMTQ